METTSIWTFLDKVFGSLRTVFDEETQTTWFVGKDVCDILGYKNTRDALITHVDEDDVAKRDVTDSLGRNQRTTLINESGLYSLCLSSKLPQAKQFKHWVTSEVLPSIYHTGYYKNEERIKQLETQVEAYQQTLFDNSEGIALQKRIDSSEYLYTASEFVKRFNYFNGTNLGRNEMLLILRDRKVLSSSYAHWNEPYQQYCKYATLHTANGCLMFKDAFFAPFAKFYKEWLDNEDARLELVVDTSIVALF